MREAKTAAQRVENDTRVVCVATDGGGGEGDFREGARATPERPVRGARPPPPAGAKPPPRGVYFFFHMRAAQTPPGSDRRERRGGTSVARGGTGARAYAWWETNASAASRIAEPPHPVFFTAVAAAKWLPP